MKDNNIFNVSCINFQTKATENTQAVVDENLNKALEDLSNRIKDPTVQSMQLTAVIKGMDDTIDIAEIALQRNNDPSEDSQLNYTLASWHHRVPDSVHTVYDTLSSNIGVYYTDMTEPDDTCETMAVAVGDPNVETILTSKVENSERSFFNNPMEDENENENEAEEAD